MSGKTARVFGEGGVCVCVRVVIIYFLDDVVCGLP